MTIKLDTEAIGMALIKKFKPTKFAALFNADDPVYDNLDKIGVSVQVKATTFSVLGPNGENIVGNIGLHKGAVNMAAAGEMPDIAKVPVAAAIKSSFAHALKGNNWQQAEIPLEPAEIMIEPGVEFKDVEVDSPSHVSEEAEDAAILEAFKAKAVAKHVSNMSGEGMKMNKVDLNDADTMYQPVKSTSAGSTYHLVGITVGGLKFAARRMEQSLAIRVGGKVEDHKNHLIAAGFNADYIEKGYTSVHFHGVDDLMAARALGAVLLGTEQTFVTPMPSLEIISGQGS